MPDIQPFAGMAKETTLATVAKDASLAALAQDATVAKEVTLAAVLDRLADVVDALAILATETTADAGAKEATLQAVATETSLTAVAKETTLQDVTNLLVEVCVRLADVADSVGNLSTTVTGQLRVNVEAVANMAAVGQVNLLGNFGVITPTAGAYSPIMTIANLSQLAEGTLRQNIVFS